MQKHEESDPSMIKKIDQCQQQLIDLVNETNEQSDLNIFDTKVRDITKLAFPNGEWPKHLEPWPSLQLRLSSIHRARGDLLTGLRHGLRGYLTMERRTGDKWVRHAFDLVQIIASALGLTEHWGRPGLPTEAQMWDILYDYLHETALDARKVFGHDAGYTRAIQAWYDDCVRDGDAPERADRDFARRFERAQKELLGWAGVSEDRGITLT